MSGRFETLNDLFMKAVLNGGFGIDVATENVDYTPASDPFISCFILPVPVVQSELGSNGCEMLSGIFQISVHYPQDQGMNLLLQKVDEVNAVFFSGAVFVLSPLTVTLKQVSTERVVVSGGFATVNISIDYYSFTSRL